ncbi:MAG TPA: AsmA-like C-terminal region-containing protein [Steroidobacteraceae bacterium]|nr:AsmA-like C-terminal region-containing protein [Steroidobacteraceae bacterium]
MSRARRIWKWAAALIGAVLVVLAVGIGGLRLWLEHSPDIPPQVVARVERLTGLSFAFARLDARLGLHGPELVFRDASIRVPGQHDALVTARAGRVGFDVWRSLKTRRLAAGRVVLEGARLYVYVTPDGIELRGQGELATTASGAHLALGDLPVGRVRIEDSSVTVQDLRVASRPLRIDRVQLDLDRDPNALTLSGGVRLPEALGARLDLEARLEGDLAAPSSLAWRANVELAHASLAGWTALVPQWPWLPPEGRGDLQVIASGRGADLAHASASFALERVVMVGQPGAPPPQLAELAGAIDVHHQAGHWVASGRDLTVDPGHDAWRHGEFDLSLVIDDAGLAGVHLTSPSIRLEAVSALVALLPQGVAREAGTALAPRGGVTLVDLGLTRGTQPTEWRVDGGLKFTGLGIGAWHAVPGVTGIDGELTAHGASGRVQVRSTAFTLDLQHFLRAPVSAAEVGATLDWWWRPDGWRFAVDDARVRSPDGSGSGTARLWLPANGESPRLVLDLKLTDIDARAATRYLPAKTIPAAVMDWLDQAFLAGRVTDVRFELVGPTREFPFRDGGGLFRIRVPFSGMRIHYQDGYADIEDATGEAEFRNQGFTAHASHARVGGLEVANGSAAMPDFGAAELIASAVAHGDASDALAFLQSSPLGPKLGPYFMKVAGHGPLSADVTLDLPFKRLAERHVGVAGRLEGASARLPGLRDEVTALTGAFTLRDLELEVPGITATMLGGEVSATARTVAGPTGLAGDRVLVVEAHGRAAGGQLQPLLGITRGQWLVGDFGWHAQARLPRYEWRPPPGPPPATAPPDATPVPQEIQIRPLPVTVHVDSSLEGLAISLPAPLAKPADEARAARLDLVIDPGLESGAPPLPRRFRSRDLPRAPTLAARIQLGRDTGTLEWSHDGEYALRRGTLRFGGGTAVLRDASGVWLEGRLADYDLSAWLAVQLTEGPGTAIGEYLRGGTVVVERFGIFGYRFPEVSLALTAGAAEWRAEVDGPAAKGTIVIPWELRGSRPLTLDLEHLVLGERLPAGSPGEARTDPTQLPGLAISVHDLDVQTRHVGSLDAQVSRTEDGLQLDSATLKGASFEGSGRGTWALTSTGQSSVVSFTIASTDLLDTLTAWGFTPTLSAKSGKATGELRWPGGIDGDVIGRLAGNVRIVVNEGQLMTVAPGAGRVLGLLSVAALPRRLTLDFTDLTDKGFAFDSITGDFEFRDGNAYTNNLVLKGPAAEIGIVGRTGLDARDYDQTAKVTGHFGGPLAAAGALAGGPAVGAALLLFSTVFKEPLSGIARGYYRITGTWEQPKVERIGATAGREATQSAATSGGPP